MIIFSQALVFLSLKNLLPAGLSLEILLKELFVITLISVPLSLLVYLMFAKQGRKILVDLGEHKWLIK